MIPGGPKAKLQAVPFRAGEALTAGAASQLSPWTEEWRLEPLDGHVAWRIVSSLMMLGQDLVREKKHLESFSLLSIVFLTFPFSPCMVYLSTFG